MTDLPKTRSINLSVEVPGTPEEVWHAVATGPGVSSWFVTSEIEPRAGGTAVTDFGPLGKEESRVAVYEPPHRFVGESLEARDDGTLFAVEWLVEAREGGTCIVRLVNSGFGEGADWDNDFDGMTQGWKLFLENLRLHLTHFRGEPGRAILPVATVPGPNDAAWSGLCNALGVASDLVVGDSFSSAGEGVPSIGGSVQHAQQTTAVSNYLLLLSGDLRGTALIAAEGKGETVMLSVWLYLYDNKDSSIDGALTAFLDERFPQVAIR